MKSIKYKIEEAETKVQNEILVQTLSQVRRQYWTHIEKVGNGLLGKQVLDALYEIS